MDARRRATWARCVASGWGAETRARVDARACAEDDGRRAGASQRRAYEEYRTSPIQRPTMTRLARESRVRDYYFAVHECEPERVNRAARCVDERRARDV